MRNSSGSAKGVAEQSASVQQKPALERGGVVRVGAQRFELRHVRERRHPYIDLAAPLLKRIELDGQCQMVPVLARRIPETDRRSIASQVPMIFDVDIS